MKLSERVQSFVGAVRFATTATIDPDGGPHQAVVWYVVRGHDLLVNSLVGRRWPNNLRRDPRFSLVVEDGLDYVSIRGIAKELYDDERARADIYELARRYETPQEAERLIRDRFSTQHRVSFLLRPERVHEHFEG
ncbi:hypothetical protein BH23CHL7_BH23CHL7_01670 [soil metagenome]